MVHFPGLARTRLWIQRAVGRFYRLGFPHSEIPGSKPACGYPGLIAACHVLHRLLAPRHPPYALSSLTIKLTQCASIREDQGPERLQSHRVLQALLPQFPSCARILRQGLIGTWFRSRPHRMCKFAFPHCATLSKFAVLRHAKLEVRVRNAYFLQLSKIVRSAQPFPIGTSPLQAERRAG